MVLYSTSERDSGKLHSFGSSLNVAFNNAVPNSGGVIVNEKIKHEIVDKIQRDSVFSEKMSNIAHKINVAMSALMKNGEVRVTQTARGIAVEINASLLFSPGDAKLTPESIKVLVAVAQILKEDDHDVQVEGHTDNMPINTALFQTNWELSAARSSRVVRLFVEQGVAPERLVAAGYGEYQPAESNDTAEGRARNRRVIVTLLTASNTLKKTIQEK